MTKNPSSKRIIFWWKIQGSGWSDPKSIDTHLDQIWTDLQQPNLTSKKNHLSHSFFTLLANTVIVRDAKGFYVNFNPSVFVTSVRIPSQSHIRNWKTLENEPSQKILSKNYSRMANFHFCWKSFGIPGYSTIRHY